MTGREKAEGALLTISEVSDQLSIPQHILRYWETRFPQLRPLQRAGNRRYYRPEDVALVARISDLLNRDGYTIKGVQKLLARAPAGGAPSPAMIEKSVQPAPAVSASEAAGTSSASWLAEVRQIRDRLASALAGDSV